MTYVLAALALACIGCAIYFGREAFKANRATAAAADRMYSQGKLADEAIAALVVDRDTWKQRADVATAQLAAAKVRLASAEQQRNDSAQAATTALVEKVRTSNAQVAADTLNALSMRVLPEMPKASDASTSDGDRGAAGVQPAGATKPAD